MVTDDSTRNNERLPIRWMAVAALCFISGFVLCYITGEEVLIENDFQECNGQRSGFLTTHKSTTTAMQSPASLLPNSRHTVVKNHSSWCPSAVCRNSDLCHPCNRRFLILIATGRSGSTSMTYMLDSLPGVRMSGENNAMINQLQEMVNGIRTKGNFRSGADKKHPWGHNHVPKGAFSCAVQNIIETINPPMTTSNGTLLVEEDADDPETAIVGFKTIRLLKNVNASDDKNLVDFVKEMFPCARFVVNIQADTLKQAKSQHSAFGGNALTRDALIATNHRMRNLVELFGRDYARLLDASQWAQNVKDINEVVEWLGFSKACFFDTLLEFHTQGYASGQTNRTLPTDCKYLG